MSFSSLFELGEKFMIKKVTKFDFGVLNGFNLVNFIWSGQLFGLC